MQSQNITRELLEKAFTYKTYNELIQDLYAEGRTTNDDNSESQLNYTKLNLQRISRWDKRAKLDPELQKAAENISQKSTWLVITEGWCGDAAQILPFINKVAELNDHIELKLILRDQYPEIMDEFLTNGSRAIPIIVMMDSDSLEILGVWGPRPEVIQKEYLAKKRDPGYENEKASEDLHLWYAKDKGRTTQQELKTLLEETY